MANGTTSSNWADVTFDEPKYEIKNSAGEVVGETGKLPEGAKEGQTTFYRKSDGTLSATPTLNISINKETGNVKITAPKNITSLPEFKQVFNEDKLREYSQAYKLNPDFKVTYTKTDDDGKTVEEKEITIPEYIETLNESLEKFVENHMKAQEVKQEYIKMYGDKARNMTDTQIAMTSPGDKAIMVPNAVLSVNYFGDDPSVGNPFASLELGENGEVSLEKFKEVYDRDKIGRSEMAGILAAIDGALKGSDWSTEDYYYDEDGNKIYNGASATEAAKLLAFRNYILSNDPNAEWYQAVGDNVESFALNALYGFDRVFLNSANVAEALFTLGGSQNMQNTVKSLDQAMGKWNEQGTLVNDATSILATLGMLGGTLVGSIVHAKAMASILDNITLHGAAAGANLSSGAAANTATMIALNDAKTAADLILAAPEISRGARFVIGMMDTARKTALLSSMAVQGVRNMSSANFVTEFLFDTVHDALLYDSATLRDALSASDQKTRDYWLGQLVDNGKWWVGLGAAKTLAKYAGKTTLGRAADAVITPLVNKLAAAIGNKKQALKDYIAGGSVVRKLEDELEDAIKNKNELKANRIKRKINQENWNSLTREAREALGDIKLDWDGLKLTDDSIKEFNELKTRVKALENGIDAYNRNISYKRQEMIGAVIDPSTGKMTFINPTLAGANIKTTDFYIGLTDLAKKYNLPTVEGSLLSQDMVDYMMGRYYENLATAFAKGATENAAKAQNALEIIREDLKNLREVLPTEITNYIDEGVNGKVYQSWYAEQNEYGMAKGLLNREKITSYENNPIWQESGYMPIVVLHEKTGYWVENTGRVDAVIEQDFNALTFNVKAGQHYADPELIRQSRLSNMARAEVNAQMFKAYSGFGSNATNMVVISGEETQYAMQLGESKKYFYDAVEKSSGNFFQDIGIDIAKVKRRKPAKNVTVPIKQRSEALSNLSPSDVKYILTKKKILTPEKPKLTSGVTSENYGDWYKGLNDSEKKYLKQQYSVFDYTTSKIKNKLSPAKMNSRQRKVNKLIQDNIEGRESAAGYNALQKAMAAGADDFENGLERAHLIGDKEFSRSSVMNQAARDLENGKNAFYDGFVKTDARGKLHNITNVDVDTLVDDLSMATREGVAKYIKSTLDDPGVRVATDTLAESSDGADAVGRYLVLRKLQERGLDNVHSSVDKIVEDAVKGKGLEHEQVEAIKKQAHAIADEIIDNEKNIAANSARAINPDLVDSKDIYDKAKEIHNRITSAEEGIDAKSLGNDYVMYLDQDGRQVFAKVDPAFASLFNYRFQMSNTEAGIAARVNANMSRLFRFGTTSINLSSFGNQMFRDFGNALFVGGSWQTIKSNADNLKEVFGENIVEQIKKFDPSGYEMKQLQQLAKNTGQSLEEAAVSRELMRGAAISPTTTERTLYKTFMDEAYGSDKDGMLTNAKNKIKGILEKYNPDELVNGKRENYLRNRVYASSLNDAMNSGYTLEQARVFAEFAMNNATTNFSRQLYHMQAIADSTPYFRAAINGTKSFWRMWSLDPVGISGRIMGGLILPTIYLTGASLGDERNREVYMNIPEYQKQNSMIFVVGGQIISIPIPQEMSSIVAPFRQFTEYLYDSNKNDFWELMMNDVLGFSPVDLQGFSTIDMDAMIKDPTIFDRISRGTARVFSQIAPIPVKSAYMLATGTDPYSGKSLRDKSYAYWNSETGSVETMDYNQNSFAKWFATLFGDWMSPELAEKVISGVFGNTGADILDDLTTLVQEGPESWLLSIGENATNRITAPFSVPEYNLVDSIWKRAVRELTTQKEGIIASKEWEALNSRLSQEKDPEERQKIISQRQDMINEYQQTVKDTVDNLENKYHGNFDRKKFAAVIQLLNFDEDASFQSGSQYSSDLASNTYWDGHDAAIRTMADLGITGTSDLSIFGYLTTDKDGKPVMRYTSPVAIMDMETQWNKQDDIHLANIKAIVNTNNLWDEHEAIGDQVDAIYAKGKLKDSDYDAIDAIYVNWNAKVMGALAPYVERMTPEAAINNSNVLDYLDSLIEVPGDYKVDKKGRHVTNKYLGEGSATQAYIRNYIKKIFKINDTGYAGGRNYSGRK